MTTQPPLIPPIIQTELSIQYNLTRWDIFLTSVTILFRNRILQVFVLALMLYNGWNTLAPSFHERTITENIAHGISFVMIFLGIIFFFQGLVGAASALLQKHHGVVGQHTLKITEEGLVERTDANETLHKWSAIHRLISNQRNLYIYTSSENFHLVPKRSIPREEIQRFEKELRARVSLK